MKLFEVINKYVGESYVRLYVIAENEERALEIARAKYKWYAEGGYRDYITYDEDYWKELKIRVICEDTSKEWVDKKPIN
jgi:hypothetical protein